MAELASFDELLDLIGSLQGRLVQARDDSMMLSADGELTRLPEDAELDARLRSLGIEGEDAESFLIGNGGRLDLIPSEFVSAAWDETWHSLTITTSRGTIVVQDTFATI